MLDGATLMLEIVERYILGQGRTVFLITSGLEPVGVIHPQTIRDMPKVLWGATTAGQVMTPLEQLPRMHRDTGVVDLLDELDDDDSPPAILLTADGAVVGALGRSEINQYMKTREELGM